MIIMSILDDVFVCVKISFYISKFIIFFDWTFQFLKISHLTFK